MLQNVMIEISIPAPCRYCNAARNNTRATTAGSVFFLGIFLVSTLKKLAIGGGKPK